MKKALLFTVLVMLGGCSDDTVEYPSAKYAETPYILKEGCKFTIVSERGTASVTSPEVSGIPGASASASVSMGDMSIAVSDCRVVENSHSLLIYEN